jgi:hypothetical protein
LHGSLFGPTGDPGEGGGRAKRAPRAGIPKRLISWGPWYHVLADQADAMRPG